MKSNTWSREMSDRIGGEEAREEGCEKNGGDGGGSRRKGDVVQNERDRE